jgi:hypothetical protein
MNSTPFILEQIRLAECNIFPISKSSTFASLANALTHINGEIDAISSNLPEVIDINFDELLTFSLPKQTKLKTYFQFLPVSTSFSLSTVNEELFQIFIAYNIKRNTWEMIEYTIDSSDLQIEEIAEWLKEIKILLITNSDYIIRSMCNTTSINSINT